MPCSTVCFLPTALLLKDAMVSYEHLWWQACLLTAQEKVLDRTFVSVSLSLLPKGTTTYRGDPTADR
jgi:hypothetical protein